MFRKINFKPKKYNKNGIKIAPSRSIDDDLEVGEWNKYYENLKFVYCLGDENAQTLTYIMRENGIIIGYFLVEQFVCEKSTLFYEKYDKKIVLNDFGIYVKRSRNRAKLLINYLLTLAKSYCAKVVEIKKVEGFEHFYKFLKTDLCAQEDSENYYLVVKEPKTFPYSSVLKVFEGDTISIENLYFLYGLNFKIYKTKCVFENANLKIEVDRKSSLITIYNDICSLHNQLVLTNETRDLIYLLCKESQTKSVDGFYIDVNRHFFMNSVTYQSNTLILCNDVSYVANYYAFLNKTYLSGFDYIFAIKIDFDYHNLYYNYNIVDIEIRKALSRNYRFLDCRELSLLEKRERIKEVDKFNEKFEKIKRFDFSQGNPFLGIKKFSVLFENGIEIKHNGRYEEKPLPTVEETKTLLKKLSFFNWKQKYNNEVCPNYENSWKIVLRFDDEVLEYEGLDEFPNSWLFLVEFIEKYSSIKLRKKESDF